MAAPPLFFVFFCFIPFFLSPPPLFFSFFLTAVHVWGTFIPWCVQNSINISLVRRVVSDMESAWLVSGFLVACIADLC